MDGIHDLGGKQGFGAVDPEDPLQGFSQRWHGSVFTMINSLAAAGVMHNSDHFRHAVERIDPISYLDDGYYGRWLGAAENLLVEGGILEQQEITDRAVAYGAKGDERVAARPQQGADSDLSSRDADRILRTSATPLTAERNPVAAAKYSIGDVLLTRMSSVPGHTRLPAYARGRLGTVVAVHGAWVFPDTNAHGKGEQPQHLYTLCFDAQELWGEGAENLEVFLDLFEPYLHRVEEA
ncbi:MAG: nitrile hydratase subunit beta [Pseudomonadaceae bacterium]|jgi:nitrile hydratase|nr:nitrile hydratase subunit beta [Pseudomonadaceae bacterium]